MNGTNERDDGRGDDQTEELLALSSRHCENVITDSELQRLEQLLGSSSRLRHQYLAMMRLNADLMWMYRTGGGHPVESLSSDIPEEIAETPHVTTVVPGDATWTTTNGPSRRKFYGSLLAVAALLLVILGISAFIYRHSPPPSAGVPDRSSPFVATLLSASTIVWSGSGDPIDVGERINPGDIWLESGEAEWLFDSGARLVVSGPARLKVHSPLSAYLESGTLVAHMPESAIGFQLQTATANLVDQGTEFGVVVESDGIAEVHVFQGQVDVQVNQQPDVVELYDGQAMRIPADGKPSSAVSFSRARFDGLDRRVASPIQWSSADGGNDHYYELVILKHSLTWQQAAAQAMSRYHHGMPGHLVTITSAAEDEFLTQRLLGQEVSRGVWIGLTDVLHESSFRWITGEPMVYQNWASFPEQQPDNFQEADWHGGEDYGMYTRFPGQQPWAWNDLSNDSIHERVSAYLVEYERPIDSAKHREIAAEPVLWDIANGGNGHLYQLVVSLESVSWHAINERSKSRTWNGASCHLATLETPQEKAFVVDNLLRSSGVPENLIGLSGDSVADLKWVTSQPATDLEIGQPFLPTGTVFGLLYWNGQDREWSIQTRSIDTLPNGWFGYVLEYTPNASNVNSSSGEESTEGSDGL